MAKPRIVTFEEEKYINVNDLIDAMVLMIVRYTSVEDLEVIDWESSRTVAFAGLLKNELGLKEEEERFRKKYVMQRFIKRTLGE